MDLANAIGALQQFTGSKIGDRLALLEHRLEGATGEHCHGRNALEGATSEALIAAGTIKDVVGQINVIIHALGMLLCLPHILEPAETIEYVSLGAGNTGKAFDLETDQRVAEFKFIRWRGGTETIRQNSLFKDFFNLAEAQTPKRKFLYVLGTEHALRFLKGRRALASVLNVSAVREAFYRTVGADYSRVGEYFASRRDRVEIVDLSPYIPELLSVADSTESVV